MSVRSGSRIRYAEEPPLVTAVDAQVAAEWAPIGASSDIRRRESRFNEPDRTFLFGPFRLILARQLLLRDGAPIRLGSRALTILAALVERRGELVTKEELMAIAWPRLFVHESNLKVNMANLRRSLGDAQKEPIYVATVYGRGYQFVASVAIEALRNTERIDEREGAKPCPPLTALENVGRDEAIAGMVAALRKQQFTCFYRYASASPPELNLPGLTERNDRRGEEQHRT